jgi:hypothetical protein
MTEQADLINLKSDVEELRARIERFESFIMKMLDRIVALEREARARDTAECEESGR